MLIFLLFAALTATGEKHKHFSSLNLQFVHFRLSQTHPEMAFLCVFPLHCDFSAGWVGASQWWYAEYCYGKSCWGCRGTLSQLLALAGTAKYLQKANTIIGFTAMLKKWFQKMWWWLLQYFNFYFKEFKNKQFFCSEPEDFIYTSVKHYEKRDTQHCITQSDLVPAVMLS